MFLFCIFIFTFVIILGFFWGMKKNAKLAKLVSENLEKTLKPLDQTYVWLGGTIGFACEYKVKKFKKIYVNLRLIPRQSILWLPISYLLGRRDDLQIFFYLKTSVNQEFHIIRNSFLMPRIYSLNKLKKIKIGSFICLYEKNIEEESINIDTIFKKFKPFLRHLALTTENNIFYMELTGNLQDRNLWRDLQYLIEALP